MSSPPMVDQSWKIPVSASDDYYGTQRSWATIELRLVSGVRRSPVALLWRRLGGAGGLQRRAVWWLGARPCRGFFVTFLFFRFFFALSLGQLGFGWVPECVYVFVLRYLFYINSYLFSKKNNNTLW